MIRSSTCTRARVLRIGTELRIYEDKNRKIREGFVYISNLRILNIDIIKAALLLLLNYKKNYMKNFHNKKIYKLDQ